MKIRHFATSSRLDSGRNRIFYESEERETKSLDHFFWNSFDYLRANAIVGDYAEFGVGGLVRSFRLAAKHRQLLERPVRLFGFDSFEGLPAIGVGDKHPGWSKGSMAVSEYDFHEILRLQGLLRNEYRIVRGWYRRTLAKDPKKYGLRSVAFAFVDCDLYEPSLQALKFCGGHMSDGGIIAFDDWNCYRGKPTAGQRRALNEAIEEKWLPKVIPFLSFGWHGQSFLIDRS